MAKQKRKILIFALLFVAATGSATYFFRAAILAELGGFLVVSDPLQKADAIHILCGPQLGRTVKAAELYHQGWAPRIIITKDEGTFAVDELKVYGIPAYEGHEVASLVLKLKKVPDHAIEIIDGYNHSTLEESVKLRDYMQSRGFKRLIVVTSNFHTRRARMVFRRIFKGTGIEVMVEATPHDYWYNPEKWWTRRMDSRTLLWEYQKLIFYAIRYW